MSTVDTLLLIFIVFMQNIAVYLDNYAVFYLASNHNSNMLASAFTRKFQIEWIARGFLFFIPPLLGLLLINDHLNLLISSLFLSSIVSLFLSLIQSKGFLKRMNIRFSFPFTKSKIILAISGILIYALYLYVPFYLNILSYYFKSQSLWIVQLSPALTAVCSIFVVYYMDPRIAKFIDTKKNKNYSVLSDLIFIRILGRITVFVISLLCILFLI